MLKLQYGLLGSEDIKGSELNFEGYAYKVYSSRGEYIGVVDYDEVDSDLM